MSYGILSMFPSRSSIMCFNNGFDSNFGGWRLLRSLTCLVDEIKRKVADPYLHAEKGY